MAEAEILVLFYERCLWRQRSMSGEIAKRSGIKIEKISFKRNFQKSTKNWKQAVISPHMVDMDKSQAPVWRIMTHLSMLRSNWAKKWRFAVSKEAQAQNCLKLLASPNKMKMSISCEPDHFRRFCFRVQLYALSEASDKVRNKNQKICIKGQFVRITPHSSAVDLILSSGSLD